MSRTLSSAGPHPTFTLRERDTSRDKEKIFKKRRSVKDVVHNVHRGCCTEGVLTGQQALQQHHFHTQFTGALKNKNKHTPILTWAWHITCFLFKSSMQVSCDALCLQVDWNATRALAFIPKSILTLSWTGMLCPGCPGTTAETRWDKNEKTEKNPPVHTV